MKLEPFYTGILCTGTALLMASGCSHKTDAKTELEKAATVLGKSESAAPQPAASPEPAAETPAASAAAPEPTAIPIVSPSQQMQSALASYKSGELEDAVTRLQRLRASPTLTAEQRMAVQDGVAAVMGEIYGLAEKGDPKAIQAVKQYELMQ